MADPWIKQLAAYMSFDGGSAGSSDFSNAIYTPPWFSRLSPHGLLSPLSIGKINNPIYSTTRSRFGTSSLQVWDSFYVYLGTGSQSGTNPVTRPPGGAITFEGWFWFDVNTDSRIMGCYTANTGLTEYAWGLGLKGGKLRLAANRSEVGVGATTVATGMWHHIACVQEQGFGHRVYLNGNLEIAGGSRYSMGEAFEIGGYSLVDGLAWDEMVGNISEVIVTFAVKYHGSSFAVPTGPLDLTGLPTFTQGSDRPGPIGALKVFTSSDANIKSTPRSVRTNDVYFGGTGKVFGDVAIDDDPDVPVRRKVWLMRCRDGVVIREQLSDPVTGSYVFEGIDMAQKYAVIAFDSSGLFNAVIADNLTPEPM